MSEAFASYTDLKCNETKSLLQTLIYNPHIFATQCLNLRYFSEFCWIKKKPSIKYQRFTLSGCKDKRIRTFLLHRLLQLLCMT